MARDEAASPPASAPQASAAAPSPGAPLETVALAEKTLAAFDRAGSGGHAIRQEKPGTDFRAMTNQKEIDALNATPIKWPKGGFIFSFGDVFFKLKKESGYEDESTYAFSMFVYSKGFAVFLDAVADIRSEIPTCPRLRRVAGTSDIGVFGQSWWDVLKTGANKLPEGTVDLQSYKPGSILVSLGKSVLLEANLVTFVADAVSTLQEHGGLVKAQMQNGFITLNFGGFDFFYGFVYACHEAGKSAKECHELLPDSGVPTQYPETFDVANVSITDIKFLYDVLKRIKGAIH